MNEDEARAILAEVEPPLAAYEREQSRLLRSEELGDRIPRVRVQHAAVEYADWRPRATRTPSGWAISGGWLDEPVPPLPTRGVPNAGGVRPMVAEPGHTDGDDAVWERWRGGSMFVPYFPREASYSTSEVISFLRSPPARLEFAPGGERVSGSEWQRTRRWYRSRPILAFGRGWCVELSGKIDAAKRGLAKGWPATMREFRAFMRETDAAWAAERAELTQRTEAA